MIRHLLNAVLAWCLVALLAAQAATDSDAASANEAPRLQSNLDSLGSLLTSIEAKEQAIAQVQAELRQAPDEITRSELLDQLRELKTQQAELSGQFESFAAAVDTSLFSEEPEQKFDWQEELGNLLKPILAELKSATAESRAIGELRNQIENLDTLHTVAAEGAANIEQLLSVSAPSNLHTRLEAELAKWRQRRDDMYHQQTALQLQLDNRLAERKSLLDETTGYAQQFFQTRGMNLFLGVAAFCAVFFGLRFVSFVGRRLRPNKKEKSFTSRLSALLFEALSVIGGLLAALVVFNMVGDWFLLGIVVIFLLGVAWASIKALPQYVETVKLMLNIGAVRENHRLVFDGIPWKVESLGFSARLINPRLDGGEQRVPVRYLVGAHSRPSGEKEEWFPCRKGDWVELADGRLGRVAYQTPSAVELTELGGSQVVYQTPSFVSLSPRILSTGFRIQTTFGIDYRHQEKCTTEIPQRMKAKLEAGLPDIVRPDLIKRVSVEFKEAGPSSLDYAIDVDLGGEAAAQYVVLRRAVSRLLVDACNEYGWEIPFQQITIHQAS